MEAPTKRRAKLMGKHFSFIAEKLSLSNIAKNAFFPILRAIFNKMGYRIARKEKRMSKPKFEKVLDKQMGDIEYLFENEAVCDNLRKAYLLLKQNKKADISVYLNPVLALLPSPSPLCQENPKISAIPEISPIPPIFTGFEYSYSSEEEEDDWMAIFIDVDNDGNF